MKRFIVLATLLLSTAAAVSQEPFNGLITTFDGKGIKANMYGFRGVNGVVLVTTISGNK